MGYYSRITGAITFDPPLSNREIASIPDVGSNGGGKGGGGGIFTLRVDTEEIETDEGMLMRRSSNTIVPIIADEVKAYHLEENLRSLVNALPGRQFSGEFRVEGEVTGDIRRVFVKDGAVVVWKDDLIWPDGTREEPER